MFIELHDDATGDPVALNTDLIAHFQPKVVGENKMTYFVFKKPVSWDDNEKINYLDFTSCEPYEYVSKLLACNHAQRYEFPKE